jgi:23S rRNA (adenine-N6)-dimethyltransferase
MVHRFIHPPVRRRPELSQHFARDTVADRLAGLAAQDTSLVVEPGAGTGAITRALAARGHRVVAIEKDPALFRILRARFAGNELVTCVLADVLEFPLPREPYAVVSNPPFNITAAMAGRLLAAEPPPRDALLVVQREAAERFAGRPRTTRLALLHHPWFEITVEHEFRRDDFVPAPSVDCVLMRIRPRAFPLVPCRLRPVYESFVRGAFGTTRQHAREALGTYFTEAQLVRLGRDLGFRRHARPSEIPIEAWLGLFRFHAQGRLGRGARYGCGVRRRQRLARVLTGRPHQAGLTEWLHNAKLLASAARRPAIHQVSESHPEGQT